MTITVVGLGKIGLPLAVQYSSSGFKVIGVDNNSEVVEKVNSGQVPFPGEDGLDEKLQTVLSSGLFRASLDTKGSVAESKFVVVVVPLYVDEDGFPQFESIDSATEDIGLGLRQGTLVSFETTLPIGTTRNRFMPILEKASGMKAGKDFFIVFSPERVFTGRVFRDLRRYPKLVGGISNQCAERGVEFYRSVLQFDTREDLAKGNGVWNMGSCEVAEFTKLAETTYRDVNIALANQFALYSERAGLNVYDVIEAANSQPFSHIHLPGIAVGGHCIPIYPQMYLLSDEQASLVKLARNVNSEMPSKIVKKLESFVGSLSGESVLVLGVSYRGGVKEHAFSGAFPTVAALQKCGANVFVYDPMYTDAELIALGFAPYKLGDRIDAAVVQADHEEYRLLGPGDLPGIKVIIDGRGLIKESAWPGVLVHTIGVA